MVHLKENAPDLLRRALSRLPVDVIATGDYQVGKKTLQASRRILEVCLELGLPVAVPERSPGGWATWICQRTSTSGAPDKCMAEALACLPIVLPGAGQCAKLAHLDLPQGAGGHRGPMRGAGGGAHPL
jgi:hypothetical protein